MKKDYLSPEIDVDLFKLGNSSVVTTSGSLEIPDIEIGDDDDF